MSLRLRLLSILAPALFLAAGCTITTEGIQQAEVPMEELFPPSKVVASYRQFKKPAKPEDKEIEAQIGNAQKLAIAKKWSVLNTLSADYGIPDRPAKARIMVMEISSKQNAYGAYTNLRPGLLADANYMKIGVHAFVDGERLIFVQDRFLITIRDLSGAADPARRTMLINFARAVSDRIPRDITDINLVTYLPYENRVPATERLDKEDPLGLGLFKSGGVTALYRIDNREGKVFMAEVPDSYGSKGLIKDVTKAMEKEGPISELSIGTEGYQGRMFKSMAMVARREQVVFGCYGTLTDKEMKNVMAAIDRRVKPYVPPKVKESKPEEDPESKK
ncbi:MAG TPA: DUF6599 family protein [Planctomycetota bacterium]|nr:DUF6599 family protein [Planctomycetota bacterium]